MPSLAKLSLFALTQQSEAKDKKETADWLKANFELPSALISSKK